MALSDQIRDRRQVQGLSFAELARQARVSKAYIHQLETSGEGMRPSADILYRIAFALGTSVGELLGKQLPSADDEITSVPEALRQFALQAALPEDDLKMLSRINYRGRSPQTVADWRYLYESIKRSVPPEE